MSYSFVFWSRRLLKLDLQDDREKKKALEAVSSLAGIDSISIDMKEKKLTMIGSVDPVDIVSKFKKKWYTEILSVGPAKEPEKKKDEGKKDDSKKDANKQTAEMIGVYKPYNPRMTTPYHVRSMVENPVSCVIC